MESIDAIKEEISGLSDIQKKLYLYRRLSENGSVETHFNGFTTIKFYGSLTSEDRENLVNAIGLGSLDSEVVLGTNNAAQFCQLYYADSLEHYYTILENYKDLAQILDIKSSLELCHFFTNLLWNGYLSASKEQLYKNRGLFLLPGLCSFDVIKGGGVCLAYSSFLDDYLEMCGKKGATLACGVKKHDITINYMPIERKMDEKQIPLENINGEYLHTINLVEEDSKMYGYDPTNLCGLTISNFEEASILNGNGTFHLLPLWTFTLGYKIDYHHLFEKILQNSFSSNLTEEEFLTSAEKIITRFNDNRSLINDVYDNIHPDLDFISQQMDEIGNYNDIRKDLIKNLC